MFILAIIERICFQNSIPKFLEEVIIVLSQVWHDCCNIILIHICHKGFTWDRHLLRLETVLEKLYVDPNSVWVNLIKIELLYLTAAFPQVTKAMTDKIALGKEEIPYHFHRVLDIRSVEFVIRFHAGNNARIDFWVAKYLGHGSIVTDAKIPLYIGFIFIDSPEM